ncbi:MAG: hypothetical protein CL523_05780 [Actinomycetales bacterium]|nr:MAG: hypothetical protein CL523_05780 [Actinomycetales bacterium]
MRLVEPGQGRLVTIDRRLSRDEDFVVRLCLVAHHADLVALTVIDMDVNGALEGQRLKIRPPVVDVDHGSEVRPVEQSHQVLIPGNQDDPQWRFAVYCVECVHLTDDHDRRDIVFAFEDGKPLSELIELGRTVGEVQGDIGARYVREVETSRVDLSENPHPAGKTPRRALALAAQPRVAGRGGIHSWPIVNAVRSIWEHRQVLRMLVLRDLQKKYTRFRLGYLWTLLEPLGMSLVLWLVFSVLLGARALGLQPYLLFLSVAILPWWWFSTGIGASTRIWRRTGTQLRISTLPTQLWVVRAMLVSLIEFIFSLPVILLGIALTGFLPGPWIVMFPVAIVVQFLLMYGLSLLIAAAAVVFPDVARLVRIVLRAMFYLSPVLYSVSNIPEGAQFIASFNPLVGVLGLYRVGWWPEEASTATGYGISLTLCLVIFVAGVLVFRKLEPRILKEV